MKKIITVIFVLLNFCLAAVAQLSFVRVDTIKVTDVSTPLVNAWAGGLNYPMFCQMDLNGDGIMDLVAFETDDAPGHDRIMPFLNYGTHGQIDYHYAPQYISHFPNIKGWMVTYDYNRDGKMDLFSLSAATNAGIMVYRNDFTDSTGLQFTLVKDPILTKYNLTVANIASNTQAVPALVDIDNDGAMDIISWPPFPQGDLEYQRNIAVDSGWSFDSLRFVNVTQCWGGFGIQVGTSQNNISSFGNVCRMAEPDTALWDIGTTINDDTQSVILVFDNTNDGLKDALIGGYADNNGLYIHNGGTPLKDSMDYADDSFPRYNVPVNLESFPYFFNLDVNNDSAKDLIVTCHSVNNYRGVLYYKNINSPLDSPIFALQQQTFLQQDMIDVGAGAAPQLFDYDADGLPDLLIGNESYHIPNDSVEHIGIALYRNTGTASHPQFKLITRDYVGIDELNGFSGNICPTFGDLDGDGDQDMIVGTADGHLQYFQNTAGAGNPANFVLSGIDYAGIHVGGNSTPQLYDLNHDGLLDLIVGNQNGIIKYYENIGSLSNPIFNSLPTIDTLGGIILKYIPGIIALSDPGLQSGYASPFFYNDSNVDKLVLGTQIGKVYVFDSITGNLSGNYHLADSLVNGEEGERLIPFIGDINHDGHPDMLVGNYNGGVALFMNTDTSIILGKGNIQPTILSSFSVYPNPASDELHFIFYHTQGAHPALEMINSIGQIIYKTDVNDSNMTLSLAAFASGIYLIRFSTDYNTQSQKVVFTKR